jgi:hypothetical protein
MAAPKTVRRPAEKSHTESTSETEAVKNKVPETNHPEPNRAAQIPNTEPELAPSKDDGINMGSIEDDKNAIEKSLRNFAKDVEADTQKSIKAVDAQAKRLEGLSVTELRNLHAEALVAESEAKRELSVLRYRAANMATTVDADIDREVVQAKIKVAEALAWLMAVEQKLAGELKDIWGTRF